jgi:hypothetical protein
LKLPEVPALLFPARMRNWGKYVIRFLDYNKNMLPRFPIGNDQRHFFDKRLFALMRLNQYRANWPILLKALRQLWDFGKVTKLETPFFEPFEKPKAD